MLTIIERARRYIAKCSPAISGQGGHNATFHVAAVLVHGFALGDADALALLREWNALCVPPWSEGDLLHKLRSAANCPQSKPRGYLLANGNSKVEISDLKGGQWQRAEVVSQGPRHSGPLARAESGAWLGKPVFCPMVLKRVAAKTSEIKDVVRFISERSPVRVESQDSASVLRRLYRRGSGEKVIVFNDMESQGQLLWEAEKNDMMQNRHLPMGDDGVWFLPQPVDGEFHPNRRLDGKLSRRSEESVTAWRYAVLESDKADADDWLRYLVQVPLQIACICESGGRSIHALVQVDATSKADWDGRIGSIKPILITLGADRGALSAVRLSRLPQAKRGERVQRLLYLNVNPDGVPIARQPKQTLEGSPNE